MSLKRISEYHWSAAVFEVRHDFPAEPHTYVPAGDRIIAGALAVVIPNQAKRSDHKDTKDTVRGEAQHHLQITMPDRLGDCRILGRHENIAQPGNVHVGDLRLRRSC
jgi:hypothetical protein